MNKYYQILETNSLCNIEDPLCIISYSLPRYKCIVINFSIMQFAEYVFWDDRTPYSGRKTLWLEDIKYGDFEEYNGLISIYDISIV